MFSTGEFSRIARVSKRLLQFYDEEGVFHPAYTDPQTGYRRYRAQQLSQLNRILALKEIGLTLTEIRQVIERGISETEVKAMLRQKQMELERSLQTGLQRLRSLEARLGDGEALPDVVLKSLPASYFIGRSTQLASSVEAWNWVRETAADILRTVQRRVIDSFSLTLPGDGFEVSRFAMEAGAMVCAEAAQTIALPAGYCLRVVPERALVATVVQSGGPDLLHQSCGTIGRWIESQGLTMLGIPREVLVEFPLPVRCENTVIESQFEVQRS